ncbi:MAG: phosphatidylglycerophosphatase A [Muribaculaceae bacterium]|nr:phosphatidylglycerophosphatase A [Muribaculaceae bacterium]MBQ9073583.1 phosphatidylglycerophosphatase A [Muribaculaceae bacterium]
MSDRFAFFHKLIATSFGVGYMPYGPGTMGALFGLLVWMLMFYTLDYCSLMIVTACLIVVFTLIGTWSASVAERFWGEDPSKVVMDETVGTWIALLAVPAGGHWSYCVAAFVLFRFFDIVKPLGVRRMERFKGGIGIMADDILAGVYSAIVLLFFKMLIE